MLGSVRLLLVGVARVFEASRVVRLPPPHVFAWKETSTIRADPGALIGSPLDENIFQF